MIEAIILFIIWAIYKFFRLIYLMLKGGFMLVCFFMLLAIGLIYNYFYLIIRLITRKKIDFKNNGFFKWIRKRQEIRRQRKMNTVTVEETYFFF
jgi:hypothetical protein